MKTTLLLTIVGTISFANTFSQTCFNTPDGVDGNQWSYKDYVIPIGYKVDSIYMGATRNGYPTNQEDFIFNYCAGSTTYNISTAVAPFDYQIDNNSEYNHWIDLTSFNYASAGMVRFILPTVAGASWNSACVAISPVQTCFATPSGSDGNGWSIKDYIIPSGYRVDSIYMDATRNGYPTSQEDFIFNYCAGSTTYNNGTAVQPFDYVNENNSLYNKWIDLTAFNYSSIGMVRFTLPTVAGAIWNNACVAISPIVSSIEKLNKMNIVLYPNPSDKYITIKNASSQINVEFYNLSGQKVLYCINIHSTIDVSELASGVYFVKITNGKNEFLKTVKFIKE